MIDFIEYVISELKSKRLSKTNALALIKQFSLHSATSAASIVLHPLLHRNTSDLSEQSYCSIFDGNEFFLKDHKVKGQKVLPGVAYLEMARAAVEKAMPFQEESTIIELRNVVWAYPIIVLEAKEVSITLFANDTEIRNGQIDFEIYSIEADVEEAIRKTIHCQGQAVLLSNSVPVKLDIDNLKEQMRKGKMDSNSVYSAYARLGLDYGPAHQGVKIIYRGDNQVFAKLNLPVVIDSSLDEYLLHPSLMDSALQSGIGFFDDLDLIPDRPSLPFALESLKVFLTCTKEMCAWVRYSQDNQPNDKLTKLDIDLCDQDGNVCVQMRGFSSRELRTNIVVTEDQKKGIGNLLAAPAWQATTVTATSETNLAQFVQRHIVLCELLEVNLKQFETLVPDSRCLSLQLAPKKNIAERYNEVAMSCSELIQKILEGKPKGKVLIQIVVAYNQEETFFAGLSGLIKTAALENPKLIGQIILVESQITTEDLAKQLQQDQTKPQDTIIKYMQGIRNVLHWKFIPDSQSEPAIAFNERGVYLITGGLGGLGVLFAKEILQRTAKSRIILTGRSSPENLKERQTILAELQAVRDNVEYRQLDIDNLEQVKQFIVTIIQEYHQINGIIHSAGMIADGYILKKTSSEFNQVLKPKVTGTFNLDMACQKIDLDFFVLFSSVASSFGNIGQADYATANGFMDQFANYRNNLVSAKQRHGKTIAINWPLWLEGGMCPDKATQELLQQTTGMCPMRTLTGMQAFYRSLELPHSQILVLEGDLQKLPGLLEESKIRLESPVIIQEQQTIVAKRMNTEIESESFVEKTQDYLRKQLSMILKLSPQKIDVQEPLEKYGIDSLLAMSLTNQLEKTFGSLPKTLFFEYQTLRELTEYFVKSFTDILNALFTKTDDNQKGKSNQVEIKPESTLRNQTNLYNGRQVKRQRPASTTPSSINSDPIAIIGLSGRYPESVDIQQYWNNLRNGKDCIIEVPKERWDWREYYSEDRGKSGSHYSKWGGFITGVDEFDPKFFNISPREAEIIDPQERIFLQHAWMAMEDAGYTRASLQISHERDSAGQVGVYVGMMYSEYQLFGAEASARGKRMAVPGSYASIANRVSYVFNLHGPSMTLDTMCSSSLSAIHLACQDLKLRRTNLAIAGGVNVSIHPNKYLFLSAGQFISTDGHCQSFGEGGDGYIPGEGVGVVILKRLSEAIQDGNHIYGVIKGSDLNHGGKTNGYSIPNPNAQTSLISRALVESKIDPRHISYIEAHGTGTKLGDPIEIAALSKAFQQHTQDVGFCLIGSAKSNIGHCESAAGIAGLTKVLLQMKYRQIVPSLHSQVLNPYIDFQKTPFVVNQNLRDWEQPVVDGRQLPRIAGISAFGAGGSNAHLIVEEYIPPTEANKPVIITAPNTENIILLSARNAEQLKQKAIDLLDFIHKSQPDLLAMSYTLQVGREAMEERVGFIVSTNDQLVKKFQAYINGEQEIGNVFQGQIKQNKGILSSISADADFEDILNKWITGRKLSKILELWVNGLELDWDKLYSDVKPSLISLPTYPFAKEKYWIDSTANGLFAVAGRATTVIHPLLHTNTSDFDQQSYTSFFNGEEFFLTDHQINIGKGFGQKLFPAVAFLEMARASVEQTLPTQQELRILELLDIAWGQPAIVNEAKQITIALFENDIHDFSGKMVDFEIYSHENDTEIVHCLGKAVFKSRPSIVRYDIEHIINQIGQSQADAKNLYIILSNMGFNLGHTFQCVKAVYSGNNVLLAELSLLPALENVQNEFILHPGIMNGALQASIGLFEVMNSPLNHPLLPIALDYLTVYSACTKEMFALIRYSPQEQSEDEFIKLDIDLCDQQGNVCVQMRGLSLQQMIFSGDYQEINELVPAENALISSAQPISIKPQSIQLVGLNDLNSLTGFAADTNPQAIQLVN